MPKSVKDCLDVLEETKKEDWDKNPKRKQAYDDLFATLGIVPATRCRASQLIA